jgi:hypothetical protein
LKEDFLSSSDLDEYTNSFQGFERMQAGFEVYRAFDQDAKDIKDSIARDGKVQMPVLSIGGEGSAFTSVSDRGHPQYEVYATSS